MNTADVLAVPSADAAALSYRSVWTDLFSIAFEHGWIDVNGVKTRYLRAGNPTKPALVLVHGTSGSVETFSGNFAAHATDYHCLAFDMLGSGFSDKPDHDYEIADYVAHTAAFMDVMGIPRASFIGVSLGAWIASKFALDHPDRTDKLILISTPGLLTSERTQGNAAAERSRAVAEPTDAIIRGVIAKLVRNPARITDDIVAVRKATYSAPGAVQAMAHVLVLQKPDVRVRNNIPEADWRKIAAPTLVIASVDDKNIWLDTAYKLAEIMPDVRLVEMKDVNHWPHFEEPEIFNALSLSFLCGDR
jgi:2-hydroxy-6-oxonona-2,4-dienedioate hydrolase